MAPMTLEQLIETLDEAGIDKAFLIAAHSGRPGLPGCYHMPYEVVARACEQYPDRFYGLAGIDPFRRHERRQGIRRCRHEHGFYRRTFVSALVQSRAGSPQVLPVLRQVLGTGRADPDAGRSVDDLFAGFPCESVGRPIALDPVACDFPGLKLIGIHVGIPWVDEMIAMAWKHEHVYIGCDAHRPKYWPASFTRYINSYGQNKVIFGTDYPVLPFQTHDRRHRRAGTETGSPPQITARQYAAIYGLED